MKHADVKRNLADYLEGDLADEKRERVDAHLDSCGECAREVEEMQQTIQLLRSLPEPETPPMIAADVMRRIRAGETDPGILDRIVGTITSILEPTFVLPASAIAVAALVVMVVQDPSSITQFVSGGPLESAAVLTDPRLAQSNPAGSQRSFGTVANSLDLGATESFAFGRAEADALDAFPDRASSVIRPVPRAVRFRFELDASKPLASVRVVPSDGSLLAQSDTLMRGTHMGQSEFGRGRRVAQPITGGGRTLIGRSADPSADRRAIGRSDTSSGGDDPRDEWLFRGLDNPIDFARFLRQKNLAEQELWVSRLAARAEVLGLMEDLVVALRSSGDASAAILGDDFAAQSSVSAGEARDWSAPYER